MDEEDMKRMGISPALLRVFRPFQLVGLTLLVSATWPYVVTTLGISLLGGPGGAILDMVLLCFLLNPVVVSLAHIVGIAPAAGGPYHWVSEFADEDWQKPLSYVVGWLDLLAWMGGTAGTAYFFGTILLALVALVDTSYTPKPWHITLVCIAGASLAMMANTFVRGLAKIQFIPVVLLGSGFLTLIISLLVFGLLRQDLAPVSATLENNAGWSTPHTGWLFGLQGAYIVLVGPDSTCHMSEETPDAAKKVPKVMINSMIWSYLTALITTIVISVFSENCDEEVAASTGQIGLAIVYAVTSSMAFTKTLAAILVFIFFFNLMNQMTVSSRMCWAFARDKGIPFNALISKVDRRTGVPMNAMLMNLALVMIVSLLPLGSSIPLNIISSFCLVGFSLTYIITIGVVARRRWLLGKAFPPERFKVGEHLLKVIHVVALLALLPLTVLQFFPPSPSPTAATMNWVILGIPTFFVLIGLDYRVRGRHEFDGPVVHTKTQRSTNTYELSDN